MEDKLNEYLDDLISLLPMDVYDKIIEEIKVEEQHDFFQLPLPSGMRLP